ncbi:MAG: chemotaxis protein CheW [Acidobacteria bacterium]|nr:chemotaxis protein CheW [Acidobacteriota bacterium]
MIDEVPLSNIAPSPVRAATEPMTALSDAPNSLENIIAAIDRTMANQPVLIASHPVGTQSAPITQGKVSAQGKYIVFSLADSRYAVPINQVIEVGEPQRITPVPNMPEWVLGVTNLRGDIISVVDCGAFLNLHEKIAVEVSSMCVVRNQKRNLITSLMVDRIEGMLNLMEEIMPLPESSLEDRIVPYLQGVYEHGGQLLNILNLEGLLSSMELTA